MKYIILALLITGYSFLVHVQVLNTGNQERAYQKFMDALNLAGHDASLDVFSATVANGSPVFNEAEANVTFRDTLAANLDLNPSTLAPVPGSMFQEPLQIQLEQFVDYSNTSTFPYTYTNPTYGVHVIMNGPSIVWVVLAQIPSQIAFEPGFSKTRIVVDAYPDDVAKIE